MTGAGIYLHIPFCIQKCRYCDFYSITNRHLEKEFVSALVQEIKQADKGDLIFDTLYIGGGTPSVLAPTAIVRLIEAVHQTFSLPADAEITLEVNPGTVTPAHLRLYRRAGVNRLNLGIQSFHDAALRFLGRAHTAHEGWLAMEWAQSEGFDNIGLDLIYGLPGQSITAWQADITCALNFDPGHLSCYQLTFEPGTPLDRCRRNGTVHPMPDARAAALFLFTHQELISAGYQHYEISNFAKKDRFRSRHNQKYWHHTPYLGFGPAAHSFVPPRRKWNLKDVTGYIERLNRGTPPACESETLSQAQLMLESIFLALRQSDGIRIKEFNSRFTVRFESLFHSVIEDMSAAGHLSLADGICALTEKGMLVADAVAAAFSDLINCP